jgi:hypothetical protein
VDYVGVFRDLQKALAIYAGGAPVAVVVGQRQLRENRN